MPLIVVVDSSESPVQYIKRQLGIDRAQAAYRVERVSPDETLTVDRIILAVEAEVARLALAGDLVLILVDIVVKERGGDSYGIDIARALRAAYDVPLYLITNKFDEPFGEDVFSEACFEDVDGVLTKGYATERLSQERLNKLLTRRPRAVASRTTHAMAPSARDGEVARAALEQRFGSSVNTPALLASADRFGPSLWSLLDDVLRGAEGTLDVMNPGRSGAIVVKMQGGFRLGETVAGPERTFVIKLGDDAEGLNREVVHYIELVKTKLGRQHVPRLLAPRTLEKNGLAAFALEFESRAEPLGTYLAGHADESECRGVMRQLAAVLGDMVPLRIARLPCGTTVMRFRN